MNRKKDFISMCDDLKIQWTERKKNNDTVIEYELAKEAVVKFVEKDRKKLLQLKAEATIENFLIIRHTVFL